MDFQELFKLLLRKKHYLVIIPMISAAIGFTLRFTTDRMYVSESQISTGLTLGMDFTGDRSTVNPFELGLSFSNLIENMESKKVVHRLGYKLLFHDLSSDSPFRKLNENDLYARYLNSDTIDIVLEELRTAIGSFMLVNKASESGKVVYELLEAYGYDWISLLDNGSIYRVGNTDFINFRFSSEVPDLSVYVVNEWALGFIEYYTHQKTNRLNESLEVLSQILKDKQRLLDETTQKLNSYKSRYVFLSSDSENDPIGELESLIRDKESETRNLNIRLQNVREKASSLDKTSSFNSRKRIIRLKDELDRLSNILMLEPNNKEVLDSLELCRNELQSEMYLHTSSSSDKNALDKLFEEENELELKYKVAIIDLQKLKDQYNIERGTIRNLASTKSVLQNLETEVEQARNDVLVAQDRYNQARSQLLIRTSNLKMSYFGDLPEDPQSRKTIMFTALGLIAGIVITVFMIVALELLDLRIKNTYRFRRQVGSDPGGYIEAIKTNGKADLKDVLVGSLKSNKGNNSMTYIQSLRKLRFEIAQMTGKVILFTSLRETAGKSFTISALAYIMSLVKKKILIVDTNFRNNSLSSELGDNQKAGGFNELGNINRVEEGIVDDLNQAELNVISKTKNPYVSLIKSPGIKNSPDEVFSKLDFLTLLNTLKKKYDFIFLEGSALNSYSDSKELLKYVDNVVCVFSVQDEFTAVDKISLQFLMQHKDVNILKILNRIRPDDVS